MRLNKILFFLTGLFSLQFVSSYSYGYSDPISRFADGFLEVISFLIGGDLYNRELLVVKALVFLLLLAIIHFTLKRVNLFDSKINGVVAVIVSLLSIRYINSEVLINFIWLPYGGLGILIGAIFPFIIFFFFIENMNSRVIRVVGWVAFIVIYFILWAMKRTDFIVGSLWWQNLALAYLAIAIISIIILLFDKSIRTSMLVSAIRKGEDTHNIVLRSKLQKELREINEALANTTRPGDITRLRDDAKRIEKAIRRFD